MAAKKKAASKKKSAAKRDVALEPTQPAKVLMRELAKLKRSIDDKEAQVRALKEKEDATRTKLERLLTNAGATSIRTPAGRFSLGSREVAEVLDPIKFFAYVARNKAWGLLQRKTSTTAVKERIAETNRPIPGVRLTKVPTRGTFTPAKN